jgi:hypothetical protein
MERPQRGKKQNENMTELTFFRSIEKSENFYKNYKYFYQKLQKKNHQFALLGANFKKYIAFKTSLVKKINFIVNTKLEINKKSQILKINLY